MVSSRAAHPSGNDRRAWRESARRIALTLTRSQRERGPAWRCPIDCCSRKCEIGEKWLTMAQPVNWTTLAPGKQPGECNRFWDLRQVPPNRPSRCLASSYANARPRWPADALGWGRKTIGFARSMRAGPVCVTDCCRRCWGESGGRRGCPLLPRGCKSGKQSPLSDSARDRSDQSSAANLWIVTSWYVCPGRSTVVGNFGSFGELG